MDGNVPVVFINGKLSREAVVVFAGNVHSADCLVAEIEHL